MWTTWLGFEPGQLPKKTRLAGWSQSNGSPTRFGTSPLGS